MSIPCKSLSALSNILSDRRDHWIPRTNKTKLYPPPFFPCGLHSYLATTKPGVKTCVDQFPPNTPRQVTCYWEPLHTHCAAPVQGPSLEPGGTPLPKKMMPGTPRETLGHKTFPPKALVKWLPYFRPSVSLGFPWFPLVSLSLAKKEKKSFRSGTGASDTALPAASGASGACVVRELGMRVTSRFGTREPFLLRKQRWGGG